MGKGDRLEGGRSTRQRGIEERTHGAPWTEHITRDGGWKWGWSLWSGAMFLPHSKVAVVASSTVDGCDGSERGRLSGDRYGSDGEINATDFPSALSVAVSG